MRVKDDKSRLREVQLQIEALYASSGDDFNLPVRYEALSRLEAILLGRMNAPNTRHERECAVLSH